MLNKGKLTSKASPFQQRVNAAKAEAVDPSTMPNRICLMLDRSSSMNTQEQKNRHRIELLHDAVDNFVARCNFADTSVAIETFPPLIELPLTSLPLMITTSLFNMDASGNTPMRSCVERCISKIPMTRGIIVSDGEATDWGRSYYDEDESDLKSCAAVLNPYKQAGIPIDCVHIGDSSGEELLRRIAHETGGVYLKFTDVSAFSNSFGYLTPGYRAMLTDGRVSAEQLGAKELY
jgi:Mg-chelatase subunit ChlD